MAKYFMLECYGPDGADRAGIQTVHGLDGVNWLLGRPFAQPIAEPIQITLDPDDGLMMPMFNRGIVLMTDELLACLRAAGVDNIDCYTADLFNPKTQEHHLNYKAVNVIGLVAAADLAESQYEAHGSPVIDVDFDSLSLDVSKTREMLFFRLAECVTGIVVHESVKKKVESTGIRYLDWTPPEEWIG